MKRKILIFVITIMSALALIALPCASVFADSESGEEESGSEASGGDDCKLMIFTDLNCDDGVNGLLQLIVDTLSAGITVAATVSIVICGIQIMTAGGNSAQIEKSKKRIVELIIGLALWWGLSTAFLVGFISPGAEY